MGEPPNRTQARAAHAPRHQCAGADGLSTAQCLYRLFLRTYGCRYATCVHVFVLNLRLIGRLATIEAVHVVSH